MFPTDPSGIDFWHLLTRLGEAQIVLPAASLALPLLLRHAAGRRLAAWWVGLGSLAALLTTASKVAFIGWGVGVAAIDFTGVSGHSMFAAAVYPVLLAALWPGRREPAQLAAGGVVLGAALALAIGFSRLVVHAHSVSEVAAGLALGGSVSAVAMLRAHTPRLHGSGWLSIAVAGWLALTPGSAPASQAHPMVTRLALALSGHAQPYVRADLHRGRTSQVPW